MKLAGAFICVNNDLNDAILDEIKLRLYITETINYNEIYENDGYVDGYFAQFKTESLLHDRRVLIVLDDFRNHEYREIADVVMFYSHGLLNIEFNKFGPPAKCIPLVSLSMSKFFNYFNLQEINKPAAANLSPPTPE